MFSFPQEQTRQRTRPAVPNSSDLFSSTSEGNIPPSSELISDSDSIKDQNQPLDFFNTSSITDPIETPTDFQKPISSDPQDSSAIIVPNSDPSSVLFSSNPKPSLSLFSDPQISSEPSSQSIPQNPFFKNKPPSSDFNSIPSGTSQSNYPSSYEQSSNSTPFLGTVTSSVQQGFNPTSNLFNTGGLSNTGIFNSTFSSNPSNLFSSPSAQQGILFNNNSANSSGVGFEVQCPKGCFNCSDPTHSNSGLGSSQANLGTPVFGGSIPNSPQLDSACSSSLSKSGFLTSQLDPNANQGNTSLGVIPSQGGFSGGNSGSSLFAPSSNNHNLFGSTQPVANNTQNSLFSNIGNTPNSSAFGLSNPQTSSGSLFGNLSNTPNNSGLGQPSSNSGNLFANIPNSSGLGQPSSNSGNLFGSSSNPPSNSGFGQPNSNSGNLFGSSSNPPSNSGFEQPNSNSGNLFGSTPNAPSNSGFGQPSPNSGNLFGNSSNPPSNSGFGQPSSISGNLFGSPSNVLSNSGFVQPSPNSGNPFGGTSNTPSNFGFSQPSSNSGNLFGGSSNAPSNSGFGQPSPNSGNLFGGSSNAPSNPGVGQPGSNSGNLFGSPSNVPSNSGFGSFGSQPGTTFGSSSNVPNNSGFSRNPNQGLFSNTGVAGSNFSSSNFNPTVPNGFFYGNTTPTTNPQNPFGSTSLFNTPAGLFPPQFPQQSLFQPHNLIPLFEEIPEPGNVYPAHITLVTKGEEPNIKLCINGSDTYYLSMKVPLKYSKFFEEKISVSENKFKIDIDFPFPSAFYNVLLWLFYRNTELLLRQISTLNQLLEVWAAANLLRLSGELRLQNILISHAVSKCFFNPNNIKFSAVFHRRFIDINFFSELLKSQVTLFGQAPNFLKTAMILEWLGERECKSEEEIMELVNSTEFKQAGEFLNINRFLPSNIQDVAALAKRYPIGIKALDIHNILSGIGFQY
ncbi:hypothetical protein SteCoe_29207 [Stentor coeruleus]|uniref:Uncharacterized protein n=1 Tax=Stentor coeruleus TaxID=5963 RepID=A0A1R2B6H8_9CILI|nr:hypothetical protein SteCoe_29207 [Stentor coeruleus]